MMTNFWMKTSLLKNKVSIDSTKREKNIKIYEQKKKSDLKLLKTKIEKKNHIHHSTESIDLKLQFMVVKSDDINLLGQGFFILKIFF